MAKVSDPEKLEDLTKLLETIEKKISNAKVLNGGFDRLELEVDEIKKIQLKLLVDFENSKNNIEKMGNKMDKIFDPTDGFYPKMSRAETILESLNQKVASLSSADEKFSTKLSEIEREATNNTKDIVEIKKITGEGHETLRKSIKVSNGIWWLLVMTTTGLLGAIGKLIWDFFIQ